MDKATIERWREFSLAMVKNAWHITDAREAKLEGDIKVFIDYLAPENVTGWDSGEVLPCDAMHDIFDDYYNSIWSERLECYRDNKHFYVDKLSSALRAGLNAATENGVGVIGFTVGDLKCFFDGKIPDWVACQYKGCLAGADDGSGIWL